MSPFTQRLPAVTLAVACALFALFLLFGMALPARTAEIVVGCDSNDLIDAIDTANVAAGPDTLVLASSCTYTLTSSDNNSDGRNGLPSVTSEIVVEGNGATIERSPNAGQDFRLIHVAAAGRLSLDNITLRHGRLSAMQDMGRGAAILNRGAITVTGTLARSAIISNTSETGGGGAIASLDGTLVLQDVSFIGNTAALSGGAVEISGGSVSLQDVSFDSNLADSGGGVALSGSTAGIDGASFNGNQADGAAGGGKGGGLFSTGGSLSIEDASFSQNRAEAGGGLAVELGADLPLTAVSFTANTATVSGGGAYLSANNALLSNVSFGSNTGGSGGGLYGVGGDVTLANSTFGGNLANSGGRAVTAGGDALLSVANNVLWDDTSGAAAEIAYLETAGGVISNTLLMGSNGSGPGWDGSLGVDGGGNIDDDPLFLRDPDPGLDGAWDGVDDDYGDLQLQRGSPAVDAGDNALVPAGLTTDLAGRQRIVNGTVDMGAYEVSEAVIYVNINSDAGPDCTSAGTSWASAFTQLSCALPAATPGAEIWVAQGTYTPTIGEGRLATFPLAAGVAVYGGFVGDETTLEQRNWETNVTVLSGDLAGDDSAPFGGNAENSYHVVTGTGVDQTAVLDGFHIRAGNANGPFPSHDIGGGLINGDGVGQGGSPTLRNLTVAYNQGDAGGGIGNQNGSDPAIVNSLIMSNSAEFGAGIYNFDNDDPTISNVTIVGNEASTWGGGIYNFEFSSPLIQNSIIAENLASNSLQVWSEPGSTPLFRYSLIEGSGGSGASWNFNLGIDGGGNIDADPLFECSIPAAPAGPPTGAATACLNRRLQSGSPAIDAGDSDADVDANRPGVQTLPSLDLGHEPRLVNRIGTPDTGIGGPPVVDMGAYESQAEVPSADFSAAPTSGMPPLTVQFSNLSSGDITSCTWDFGDESGSSVCAGSEHEYVAEGVYTVTLSVSGPAGQDSLTKTNYIVVDDLEFMYIPAVLKLP
jgi:predicted outer membrane repeat protein